MINILVIFLLILVIVLIIYILNLIKKQEFTNYENVMRLNELVLKNNSDLKYTFNKDLLNSFSQLSDKMTKIDTAQQNIDKLSVNISEFQRILTDKKTRGIYGEVQLNQILFNIFGNQGNNYDLQYSLDSKVVDAIVFAPDPINLLPIDSKFPLENYRNGNKVQFEKDVKKHINDIKEKYTNIKGIKQAIMFIPAESIFAEILSSDNLIDYAYSNNIWVCSPTTLTATLTTIQSVIINNKRAELAQIINKNMSEFEVEFSRYAKRWDKLNKDIENLVSDARDIQITTEKIVNKFNKIKNGD